MNLKDNVIESPLSRMGFGGEIAFTTEAIVTVLIPVSIALDTPVAVGRSLKRRAGF